MTRGKKTQKKWHKRRNMEEDKPNAVEAEKKLTPISSLFKGEELQEVASILQVEEPDDSHSLLGAVVLSKFDIVKRLLKEGHSIDCCTKDGTTALMWSIQSSHWEMLELIVKRGADLNLEDNKGNTALLVGIQAEGWSQEMFLDFWNLIKESKYDINHQNKMGNSMLHHAVRRQWEQVVEVLTNHGADTNIATNKGVTPIMMACSRHQIHSIHTLLSHSANPFIEDKKGCTGCCYAIAYMIQKRITTLDFAVGEMIKLLNKEATKVSMKMYLQRRLELLQNPPIEKFHKTISSVIANVITFFTRFLPESIDVFIQLNVFKLLRNGIEKHWENNDYLLSLLNVVTELVRQCDCCMPYFPSDTVFTAFNEAGVPAVCLRIIKRFGSIPALQGSLNFTFLPIFLTSKHHKTKTWLQRNYKNINPHYLQVDSSSFSHNVYPDDYHSKLLLEHFLHFKSLMALLQKGNIIEEEVRQPKKKKKDKTILQPSEQKKDIVDHEFLHDHKSDELSTYKEDESVVIAVLSNRKIDNEFLKTTETGNKDEVGMKLVWQSKKLKQRDPTISNVDHSIFQENFDEETIYPKWREEFKDGCELFGIDVNDYERHKFYYEDFKKIRLMDEEIEMENYSSILHLEELFLRMLFLIEIVWQRDFSGGYINAQAISDIPAFSKLMYNLPNMEAYYVIKLSEKWKKLCKLLKSLYKEKIIFIAEEVRQYLESTLSAMSHKYQLSINVTDENDILKGVFEYELNSLQCRDCDTNECSYIQFKEYSWDEYKLLKLDDSNESVQGNVQLLPVKNKVQSYLYCLNINGSSSETLENKISQGIKYKRADSPPPPPGFIKPDEMINKIYEENWRQLEFSREKHESLVSELQNLRLEYFKQRIPLSDVILPPQSIEEQFIIGVGGSFGPVILALDSTTAKPVVVKRIFYKESLAQQMRSQKLCALMRRLKNIQAKCLIPYTHCLELEQCTLLATPLCQQNLDNYMALLKKGKYFTRLRARSLTKQVLSGVHFLHSQDPPIIHGNLKPSNILIDAMGQLRLSEFGIHEILYQQICPSLKSGVWWSRETYLNYHGSWKAMITFKSDIQVCGMISHYILSNGYHPFGLNPADIAKGILNATPILRLDEPDSLDLISWMISSNPKERPTSVQIMEHIFNWNRNKKWKFLLVCAGVIQTKIPLNKLYESIDKNAKKHCIDTKWMKKVEKRLNLEDLGNKYSETISGLLQLLRHTLPSSSKWFLRTFPRLPFTLYRLLQGTYWFSVPDFTCFRNP